MKPTINEIEKAKQIVNNLIKEDFFEAIICEDNDNFFDWCNTHRSLLGGDIKVYCGETKACIVSNELSNWVIKVGFTYNDEYRDEDVTDFCAIEARNFEGAAAVGLEEFFAASYKLCELTPPEKYNFKENISFFIQEKAVPDEEKTSSTCASYMGSNKNNEEDDEDNDDYYCDEYDDYDDDDRLESLFYGNEKYDELTAFIHEFNINDLHSGNFGYTPDGRVKIIDYSGF